MSADIASGRTVAETEDAAMSIPGMALVEELETGANELLKVMWVCTGGHNGITPIGRGIVCVQCCHGGEIPSGLACERCGATSLQPMPVRGPGAT